MYIQYLMQVLKKVMGNFAKAAPFLEPLDPIALELFDYFSVHISFSLAHTHTHTHTHTPTHTHTHTNTHTHTHTHTNRHTHTHTYTHTHTHTHTRAFLSSLSSLSVAAVRPVQGALHDSRHLVEYRLLTKQKQMKHKTD